MNDLLLDRTKSGFPISIGTGIALETIFEPISPVYDDTRQVPDKVNPASYTNYIFNISTLLRNLLGSVSSKDVLTLSKTDILYTLQEEIEWLTEFFSFNGHTLHFYIHNYDYVKNTYGKDDILRKATTDKQIYLDSIYHHCLAKLAKEDDVQSFSKDIKYNKEDKALILTHVPWDLLSYGNFVKLDLLESHTGVIKTRKSWNTKYHPIPDKDMSFLPFMEYLLVKFGDHVMFKPAPIKDRIELYDAMRKKNVNPLTSELSMEFLFGK